jgi:DNA-binding transcriptional regulator YiaG
MQSPIAHATVQALTLRKACELSGGVPKLARFLHVPASAVKRWLDGGEKPPARIFLDCVDILLFHERHLSAGAA